MTRRLVSQHRSVPAARRAEYDALWADLHRVATARGGHAWRFASAGSPDRHLEFLEFRDGADPRDAPELAALLSRLGGEIGPAEVEEWEERP